MEETFAQEFQETVVHKLNKLGRFSAKMSVTIQIALSLEVLLRHLGGGL